MVLPDLEKQSAREILTWVFEKFGTGVAIASSFGFEDMILIDLAHGIRGADLRVFTLDTGRLHEETYEIMDRTRSRYGITVETFFPDREAVENLTRNKGFFSFRNSVEERKECCRIRKVEPLGRALSGLDAWVTGLRREQSVTRTDIPKLAEDSDHPPLIKVNPLADWTEAEVLEYVQAHKVPVNALHARNFPSIGCAPCTRPIEPGEDIRAGRWWWENPEHKECGLHRRG